METSKEISSKIFKKINDEKNDCSKSFKPIANKFKFYLVNYSILVLILFSVFYFNSSEKIVYNGKEEVAFNEKVLLNDFDGNSFRIFSGTKWKIGDKFIEIYNIYPLSINVSHYYINNNGKPYLLEEVVFYKNDIVRNIMSIFYNDNQDNIIEDNLNYLKHKVDNNINDIDNEVKGFNYKNYIPDISNYTNKIKLFFTKNKETLTEKLDSNEFLDSFD